ncbi:MAG: hypothetical protein IJY46_10085 [Lentisphaeria bacterium]|nr:hypothetical protein [Lentisphaeria bacterium]
MKSFRLYRPVCPVCSSKNCGFAHSAANWIMLLLLGTEHYRCRDCKHEWFLKSSGDHTK